MQFPTKRCGKHSSHTLKQWSRSLAFYQAHQHMQFPTKTRCQTNTALIAHSSRIEEAESIASLSVPFITCSFQQQDEVHGKHSSHHHTSEKKMRSRSALDQFHSSHANLQQSGAGAITALTTHEKQEKSGVEDGLCIPTKTWHTISRVIFLALLTLSL
jgi:hypothetical protein